MAAAGITSTKVEIVVDEIDIGQVLYHANYLKIAERVRNQILADRGFSFQKLWQEGFVLAVGEHTGRYINPIFMGSILVATRINAVTKSTIKFEQAFFQGSLPSTIAGDAVFEELTDCCYISATTSIFADYRARSAKPIPAALLKALR